MCGLLILKHVRDISDESVVEQWSENPYYQYFCGMDEFSTCAPCASTELVHFRKRIGESGIELILAESIRVNDDHDDKDTHKTAFIDSTVQEKNVTFPTDAKLLKKVIEKIMKIVEAEGLPLRQSYRRTLKTIFRDQRFRNHPKNWKKARRADKRLRTIAGRLLRELQRNLGDNHKYDEQINIFARVVDQKRSDKNKIYSIHEPEVQCISKGKEHKKYEFGNKVSIVRSITGLILGALSFHNEYDGHTIEERQPKASGEADGTEDKGPCGRQGLPRQERGQRHEDTHPQHAKGRLLLLQEAKKTGALLQAGRDRTDNKPHQTRLQNGTQLLQRCVR